MAQFVLHLRAARQELDVGVEHFVADAPAFLQVANDAGQSVGAVRL